LHTQSHPDDMHELNHTLFFTSEERFTKQKSHSLIFPFLVRFPNKSWDFEAFSRQQANSKQRQYKTEHFMAMQIHVAVVWIMKPWSDVVGYRRFGGPCCLHIPHHDMVWQPRGSRHGRQYSCNRTQQNRRENNL